MSTVPNQKVVRIEKPAYKANFLQVGNEEWKNAARTLSPSAFQIYLYLASNANGYNLALSQKAIENELDISKSSYHRALDQLRDLGYIYTLQGNIEIFVTSPKNETPKNGTPKNETSSPKNETGAPKNETKKSQICDFGVPKMNIEIDNIYTNNIDNINKDKRGEEGTTMHNDETQTRLLLIDLMKEINEMYPDMPPAKQLQIDELNNFIKNPAYTVDEKYDEATNLYPSLFE